MRILVVSVLVLLLSFSVYGMSNPVVIPAYVWFFSLVAAVAVGLLVHLLNRLVNKRILDKKLQVIDKLRDEFFCDTSAQLQGPLNAIISLNEALIDGVAGELPEQVAQNLSMVAASGSRLSHLINDLMDFSKLKNASIEMNLIALDLRSMTDVVLALHGHMIGAKDLRLVNAVPPGLPSVYADEQRLQQILHNLVGNAVKNTKSGNITVSAAAMAQGLAVTVTDTGKGLSGQQVDCLFNAFEPSSEQNMVGLKADLGLSVSKLLVELQGGSISVKSEVGTGSSFTFTIPKATENTVKSEQPKQLEGPQFDTLANESDLSTPKAEYDSANHRFRILVVDDELVNRQVLINQLMLANYQVVEVASGQAALYQIENNGRFDMVLLDVMMPGMSGYEVCRSIREKHSFAELPVIFLTAKNQILDLLHSFEVGGNDYLTKPVSKLELLARMKLFLSYRDILAAKIEPEQYQEISRVESQETVAHNPVFAPDLAQMRVLLVDDDQVDRELTTALINDTGALVTWATDGQGAIDNLRLSEFDLVLMNIEMPQMDGMEATRYIRRELSLTTIPIIALTGHDVDEQKAVEFIASGMDDHLTKPVSAQSFYQVLCAHLIKTDNPFQLGSSSSVTSNSENFLGRLVGIEQLDVNTALAKMNGRAALYRSVINTFIGAQAQQGENILALFDKQAWDELFRTIHSLKSNAAYIGAFELASLSEHLLSQFAEQSYDRELVAHFNDTLQQLLEQLDSVVEHCESSAMVELVSQADDGARNSVLVIEDSPQMQTILETILSEHYQVAIACDGEQGIEMAKEIHPDIIISDLVMPGKNGYEVCNALKADDTTCHIPFVLLTAKSDLESRMKGWREQADEYLTKPFDENELKLRISNLLGIRRAIKQRFGETLQYSPDILPEVIKEYSERDQQFLHRFRDLMEQRCAEHDLKIGDVANELHLTVRTLQNKLKSLTDNNFTEYLKETRLSRAKQLLKKGKKVADVAWETGFAEQTYFSKFFKEHIGETPTQYKKRESV